MGTLAFASRVSLVFTLIMTLIVMGPATSGRERFFVILFYVGALMWREWRFSEYDFFGDLIREKTREKRKIHYVFGFPIESGEPENEERKFRLDAGLRNYQYQSRLVYWGAFGFVSALFFWKRQFFPFTIPSMVALFLGASLAQMSRYGQILLPLYLSALAVLSAHWFGVESGAAVTALYTVGFFSTLVLHHHLRITYIGNRTTDEKDFEILLKRALVSSLSFLFIVVMTSKVLPERRPRAEEPEQTPAVPNQVKAKAIRAIAEKVAKLERPNAPAQSGNSKDSSGARTSSGVKPASGANSGNVGQSPKPKLKVEDLMKLASGSERAGSGSSGGKSTNSAPVSGNGGEMPQLSHGDMDSLRRELARQTPEDLERLEKELRREMAEPKLDAEGKERLEALAKEVERVSGEKQTQAEAGISQADGSGSSSGNRESADSGPEGRDGGAMETSKADPHAQAKRIEELEKKFETLLDKTADAFKWAGIASILGLLGYLFLRSYDQAKKPAHSIYLDEEKKKEIRDQLARIRARALSPQEEVIETYNVMLGIFEAVQLGREEGTPAKVFADEVKRKIPRIGPPLLTATDCFDTTLYGERAPSPESLKGFRKSTDSVFRQFDVSPAA